MSSDQASQTLCPRCGFSNQLSKYWYGAVGGCRIAGWVRCSASRLQRLQRHVETCSKTVFLFSPIGSRGKQLLENGNKVWNFSGSWVACCQRLTEVGRGQFCMISLFVAEALTVCSWRQRLRLCHPLLIMKFYAATQPLAQHSAFGQHSTSGFVPSSPNEILCSHFKVHHLPQQYSGGKPSKSQSFPKRTGKNRVFLLVKWFKSIHLNFGQSMHKMKE